MLYSHLDAGFDRRHTLFEAAQEEQDVVVCTITIYELLRHRMRDSLDPTVVDLILENRAAFRWVGTDPYDLLHRAAGISHGMGLHIADALTAAACETSGSETFYTRNAQDFELYEEPMEVVFLD